MKNTGSAMPAVTNHGGYMTEDLISVFKKEIDSETDEVSEVTLP